MKTKIDTLLDLRNNCTRRLEEGTMPNAKGMIRAIDKRLEEERALRAIEKAL